MTVVKCDARTYAPHVFDTDLLPLMDSATGWAFKTTVDPALIRGLRTALPARSRQALVTAAQPCLRFPGDLPHRLRQTLKPDANGFRHPGEMAIAPGALDQDAARAAVSGQRQAAAFDPAFP